MSKLQPGQTVLAVDPGRTGGAVLGRMREDGRLDLVSWCAWHRQDGKESYYMIEHGGAKDGGHRSPFYCLLLWTLHMDISLWSDAVDRAAVEGLFARDAHGMVELAEATGQILAAVGEIAGSTVEIHRPLWRQWVHVWRQGTKPGAKALERYAIEHAYWVVIQPNPATEKNPIDWISDLPKWARGHVAEACGIALYTAHLTRGKG